MNCEVSGLIGYRSANDPSSPIFEDLTRDPLSPIDGSVLEAVYDLPGLRSTVDRDRLLNFHTQWDWRCLLPIRNPENVVTLHEGGTPLIKNRRLGASLGLNELYVKDESRNPTGSFKDRGSSVTISKCREVGTVGLTVASSGNLACSIATYASLGGMDFYGFIRDDTTDTNRLHCLITGQHFFIVEGGMLEGSTIAAQVAERFGLFHAVQPYNLYRVEGKKTIAFEICRDLGWRVPDRVLVPSSGCTNILALYKGFSELQELGWIDRIPALDVVQPAGCAPLMEAWLKNSPVQVGKGPGTSLIGLGHPFPKAGDKALEIVKKTGGRCYAVSDDAAFEAQKTVARSEGLFFQPASVVSIAALASGEQEQLRREARDQVIVWIGTGTGKNQLAEPLRRLPPTPRITGGIEEFALLNPNLSPVCREGRSQS
jgi:threonine synthase